MREKILYIFLVCATIIVTIRLESKKYPWLAGGDHPRSVNHIQYWSPHTNGCLGTAQLYIDRGHNLYNFARLYTYYTLLLEHIRPYFTAVAKKALGEF